jgi:ubiquinone/menaquinone biosynthesis C-methylase UbiE
MKNNWDEVYKKGGIFKYYDMLKAHPDISRIIDIFKQKKVIKVLDLGCGLGNNLMPLAVNGFEVSGLDMSPQAITKLKESLKKIGMNADLKVGLLEKLPYKDSEFDAVICVQTLPHGRTENIKKGVSEMVRVLKKGGMAFVTIPGRVARGEIRYCLVKTAKKVEDRVYIPTKGSEVGIPHFIFNKSIIYKMFNKFKIIELQKDYLDYYSVIMIKK